MRTETEIRAKLASTREDLAALQKQYRDLTDTHAGQGVEEDIIALEGSMARLRAFIRALDWVLGKA